MQIFRKKRCFQFLKFVKLFSDKNLQTISFWQLAKREKKEKEKEYVCGGKKAFFFFFPKRISCICTWQLTWERNVEVGEKPNF